MIGKEQTPGAWQEGTVVRIPCPLCHELILPNAKKCPHCKELLDPALRAERNAEVQLMTTQALKRQELDEEVSSSFIQAIIGGILFCYLGIFAGPVVMLSARRYRKEYQKLGLVPSGKVKSLSMAGVVWLVVGIVLLMFFIIGIMNKP